MYEFALKKMRDLDASMDAPVKKSKVKKYRLSILQDYEVPDSVTVGGIEWEVNPQADAGSWSGKTSCYYEHTESDGPTGVIHVDIAEGKIYGKIDNIRESVTMTTSLDGVYEDVIAMGEALTDIWNKNAGEGVGKSKKSKTEKSQIKKYSSPSMSKFIDACSGLTSEERYAFDQVISNEFVTGMGFDEFIDTLTFLGANLLDDTEE